MKDAPIIKDEVTTDDVEATNKMEEMADDGDDDDEELSKVK